MDEEEVTMSRGPAMNGTPHVSVVIPARNEEGHIGESLAAVFAALAQYRGGEILVVDGRSSDRTREIVESFAATHPGVRLIDNPRCTTPVGFNLGIGAARAAHVAIVSAHSRVDPGFFSAAFRRLDAGEADVVGGPIRAEAASGRPLAWLLAQVVSHPFGVGNSRFRVSSDAGYVDAVPFAVFRREVFTRIGLFDEKLVRNQDTEFFGRAAAAGVRVFLEPGMGSVYFARGTLAGLLSQGFRNAYWNVLVWRMRPVAFQWRHLIPGLFTSGVLAGPLLAAYWRPAGWLFAAALLLYFGLACAAALQISRRSGRVLALVLPPIFFLYHFCYGAGSIVGLRHLLRPGGQRA